MKLTARYNVIQRKEVQLAVTFGVFKQESPAGGGME
jgi:hypothetical protein